ncbi:MAG TPA: C1 family peptidase [Mucilaginibacter sp.]|nr:C1 family peptidase [Mucilaginibacter sp.]
MNRYHIYYGWVPDLPDHRDFKFSMKHAMLDSLPAKVDLRDTYQLPPIYDQGPLGSCTADAIAGAFEFELLKQQLTDFTPSRLFIYYNERVMENSVNTDSGASLRDGIKTVASQGVCDERLWPYIISEFNHKPYDSCYQAALQNIVSEYYNIDQDLDQMKNCLAHGYPFVFGFSVYESFEDPSVGQTGIVSIPGPDESIVGGHAVMAVGYDDTQGTFTLRNSWGTNWGMGGYFTMPYEYLTRSDLSGDFWNIKVVTESSAGNNATLMFNEKNERLNIAKVKAKMRGLSGMPAPTTAEVHAALEDYYNLASQLQAGKLPARAKPMQFTISREQAFLPGLGGKILAEIKKIICGILDGGSTQDDILSAVLDALASIIPGGVFIESLAKIVVKYVLSQGITNFCQVASV